MTRAMLICCCLAACSGSSKPAPAPAPIANAAPVHTTVTALDCVTIADKIGTLLALDKPMTADDRQNAIVACQQAIVEHPTDPTMLCALSSATAPAFMACIKPASAEHHATEHATERDEAKRKLKQLGKNAKVYYVTMASFPPGKAAQLPAQPCCAQPNHHCAVTTAWAADGVWASLDFEIDEPNVFQYTYEGSDATFHATAVGDPGCTGKVVTYTLDGAAPNGNPAVTLIEPPASAK